MKQQGPWVTLETFGLIIKKRQLYVSTKLKTQHPLKEVKDHRIKNKVIY